jgi:hypothetical protein
VSGSSNAVWFEKKGCFTGGESITHLITKLTWSKKKRERVRGKKEKKETEREKKRKKKRKKKEEKRGKKNNTHEVLQPLPHSDVSYKQAE